ncbi:hypothetical protein [Nocardia macrotermitis]|uniref:Secreted protein n=1 Tax=Nocardia macrotermitis TaxID=2585198 RepID=A0A7K0D7S0_9NOCA|nr:hypothetical protein [Nocardia macrotermitis]MQY21825.1 hypothetical protein [Nocardia macrotermitis]
MSIIEKLCVAAVVAGGLTMGAGAANAAATPAPVSAAPVADDGSELYGSTAGVPNFLSSGLPDLGSSAGSVGSLPALGGFALNAGSCGLATLSSIPFCVPG